MGVGDPLLVLDRGELAGIGDPAGRLDVVEDRLVPREALEAHHLLDQQASAAVARAVLPELAVALGRDLAELVVPHRLPLLSCSRSIASNRALKLPSPKPRAPWRSITSRNRVGRSPSGLREDLQQVALVVAVGEDAELAQVVEVLVDLADPIGQLLVVAARGDEEADAALLQRAHGGDDVGRRQRDVLHAGAAVELQVLLDLGLALALGRLVDRELDAAVAVGHHLRHQRRVLGRDVLVGEADHLGEAEDALVVADPLLHAAELDVADHVVDAGEQALVVVRPSRPARSRAGTAPS